MPGELTAAPALSTPAEHLFEHVDPEAAPEAGMPEDRSDNALREIYEVGRTAREIRQGSRRRVALQFPDSMLGDAPRIVALLHDELASQRPRENGNATVEGDSNPNSAEIQSSNVGQSTPTDQKERIYILADTSYSACCVDEIAAEHVHADVVVHYGRSCLSPTSRLPVIYVFTKHKLDHDTVIAAFEQEHPEKSSRVVLMADVTYQDHISALMHALQALGYSNIVSTSIVHDPLGLIPNRKVVDIEGKEVSIGERGGIDLLEYSVFHVSSPPTALLLALSSRVKALHIFTTGTGPDTDSSDARRTRALLGRRYARVLTLATAGIIGILVNTLSVSNYLSSIDSIRKQIAAAGKKSYTVVVGKLNPAKLANFAEIDGWVIIGCWESSLVEDDAGFFRPVITPFELEAALMSDEERIWGVEWWGGIETVGKKVEKEPPNAIEGHTTAEMLPPQPDVVDYGDIEDEESEPPQFDLRTGKLVSHSRPMRMAAARGSREQATSQAGQPGTSSDALTLRPKSDLATVNGVVSPGAEYLRSQRTWQGLGSDYSEERSAAIEEGRSGVARGYTIGEHRQRS